MRRNLLIILGALVLVWGVLAIVLGSASLTLPSGSSSASAASPACLPPAGHETTAALGGTSVDVSPAPGSGTANPHAQVSFLGVPARAIGAVSVTGARSGAHPGRLEDYSQGDGASFVPDRPFSEGERVEVRARIGAGASAKSVSFQFGVDTPYPTANTPEFPSPPAAPADYQSLYTMPGVHPPVLTVTTPDRDPAAGDVLTTNGPGPGQQGPLIYTPQGTLVWFEKLSNGETAEDLNEQAYEGRRVLTLWRGRVLSLGFGQGEDVVLDSRYETVARIAGGNGLPADLHDFQLAGDHVAYITAFNPILCDLRAAKGTRGGAIVDTAIEEIDMRTGLVRWEWHSLDHVGAAESEVEAPNDAAPWDYFHLNSIDPEPNGDLLVSARSTWAGYLLARGSGRVLWRLGGNRSSFRMGPGTTMAWQHDGRALPDGEITFFDDGANPPIHHQSRGVRISLNLAAHEARLARAYTHHEPALLAASQGNMQTLADGNAVIGYGAVPEISEYSPGGALLFDAHQPYDMTFYRAFRFPWSATPASPPTALATQNNTGEETIVHASWNGATGVGAWRVLAGSEQAKLTVQATIPASGFESATTLPRKYGYVAVQALTPSGRVLRTSATVAVIGFYASLADAKAAG